MPILSPSEWVISIMPGTYSSSRVGMLRAADKSICSLEMVVIAEGECLLSMLVSEPVVTFTSRSSCRVRLYRSSSCVCPEAGIARRGLAVVKNGT